MAGDFYVQAPKEGRARQRSAFVLTIDPVLKFIESKFEVVNVRAIHDITMVGPTLIIFGTDGAHEALLDGLAEVGLEPQRTKFQALGTTEEALADKPEWLLAPSVVIDPANGERFRAFGINNCGALLRTPIRRKLDSGEVQKDHRY